MDFRRTFTTDTRLERLQNRGRKARIWSRLSSYALIVIALVAIWQEPRLSPKVHDGMQMVAGHVTEYTGDLSAIKEKLAAATSTGAEANDGDASPVTAALVSISQ